MMRRARLLVVACLLVIGCTDSDPLEPIRSLQQAGRWEASAEALKSLVENDPEDPRLQLAYGRALLAIAEPTRAIWPLRRARETEAFAIEAGVLLAQALLSSANSQDAIAVASAVLAQDPENQAALFARSRAYLAAKSEEDALNDADLLVELDPTDPQARFLQLGILLMLENEREAAEALADAAPLFALDGPLDEASKARFCMLETTFAFERGESLAGQAQAEACLDRFPDQPLVIERSAALFDQAERPERATEILREALAREPKEPMVRLALARRMETLGDAAEAERLLQEGTSLLPGPSPWLVLHDYYVRHEDFEKARDAIEQALDRDADPPAKVLIAYADDLILTGALDRAEAVAMRLPPPGSHFVRGRSLLVRRDPKGALREIEKGLRLWPDNPTARWLAGQAAEAAGDFPLAISHYRESVRADPTRAAAAKDLAEIYAAMGAGPQAIEFASMRAEANAEAAVELITLARRFQSESARALGLAALQRMPRAYGHLVAQTALDLAARDGDSAGIASIEAASIDGAPGELDAIRALAEIEQSAGVPIRAIARIRAVLARDGETIEPLLLLVSLFAQTEATREERLAALDRAASIDSSDPRVLLARARFEAEHGASDRAVELYDSISQGTEQHATALLESAELLLGASPAPSEGHRLEVSRRLEAALELEPRNAAAALALARQLAEVDPVSDRALALARRATLLGGGAPAAGLVGRLWLARGEIESAERALEQVIASFPEDAYARYWLARVRASRTDGLNAGEPRHDESDPREDDLTSVE